MSAIIDVCCHSSNEQKGDFIAFFSRALCLVLMLFGPRNETR